ncbi:MAG: hypothetical protein APF84_16750 [Gracilibacter sp. BRH_c7a]|nr:MAG: hypothetical protein APF84_16750 [Gracilibacter sp. BRH_c7a]
MNKKNNQLNNQVKSYVESLFSGIGTSQQLFDLKEELATNLKEKTLDYTSRGMDEQQAFKEAVISMGDLSGLVADMRLLGQDKARQAVYSTMTARISLAGIVFGVLLTLFGIFTIAMLYFMKLPGEAVAGSGIFIVAGGALITYSILTRETTARFGMNKIRAALYAISIGLILFGMTTAFITRYSTGEMFIAIGSLMVFFLVGVGLFLFLALTETDRRKSSYR